VWRERGRMRRVRRRGGRRVVRRREMRRKDCVCQLRN